MDGRRTSTIRQIELLLEFAEAHKDLALGRLRSKEARALSTRLWRECAENLNAEGPARLPKEWTKIWNDLKSRVRIKLSSLNLSQRATGGGPNITVSLSSIEERVANIIGRDIGPLPNVTQNPFLEASIPQNAIVEVVNVEQHVANEIFYLPGPSLSPPMPSNEVIVESPLSLLLPQPPQSPTQSSPRLPSRPVSPGPSPISTPRRHRQQPRSRPRPRHQRATRPTPAQTNRGALDESRAMVMRIEEMRARSELLLAEAAKAQADAALARAEADRLRAQTTAIICQSVSSLVPAICSYLQSQTRRARRTSTSTQH